MIYISRKIENTIIKYIHSREIIAIIGPRQCGKTTVLKKLQRNLRYSVFLSFEDIDTLALFEENIKEFAERFSDYRYIFIDEFQYAKSGGKNLKYLFDFYPDLKIIISGSSAIDLTVNAIKFLVGRIFIFPMYQLDFEEYLEFKDKGLYKIYKEACKDIIFAKNKINIPEISDQSKKELDKLVSEFMVWGGYPRVALSKSVEEKKTVLLNIYNTYFLREIRDVLGLIDDFRLAKLIQILALQSGQLIEYNSLSAASGYDNITLKKYLNILEKTFILVGIKPYFKNKQKEIVKNPKIYFLDSGLKNHIVNNFNKLSDRNDRGFLEENFIFTESLKKSFKINFWRTKTQAEVDFIIEISPGSVLPMESKSVLASDKIPSSVSAFCRDYSVLAAIVFNFGLTAKKREGETAYYFLPFWTI